jgi:TRAP-type C4-dicarboxylate transport system permease small subunit
MKSVLTFLRNLLVQLLGAFLIAAFAGLVLDVLWGVFSRYILGSQTRWTEELAIYLLVWISLLGAALTYAEHGHLGVDYFVGKLDPAAQWLAALAVALLVLGFSLGILCYGGFVLVSETLSSGQISPALGWPVGYAYLAVPLSGLFFTLFALEHFHRLCRTGASTKTH